MFLQFHWPRKTRRRKPTMWCASDRFNRAHNIAAIWVFRLDKPAESTTTAEKGEPWGFLSHDKRKMKKTRCYELPTGAYGWFQFLVCQQHLFPRREIANTHWTHGQWRIWPCILISLVRLTRNEPQLFGQGPEVRAWFTWGRVGYGRAEGRAAAQEIKIQEEANTCSQDGTEKNCFHRRPNKPISRASIQPKQSWVQIRKCIPGPTR